MEVAVMDAFTRAAITTALSRMFRAGGHFDICTVKNALEVAKIPAPEFEVERLGLFHCVHWSAMDATLRATVVERTLALFDEPAFDVSMAAAILDKPKSAGLLGRITGRA
jgi:hypothetical protein